MWRKPSPLQQGAFAHTYATRALPIARDAYCSAIEETSRRFPAVWAARLHHVELRLLQTL